MEAQEEEKNVSTDELEQATLEEAQNEQNEQPASSGEETYEPQNDEKEMFTNRPKPTSALNLKSQIYSDGPLASTTLAKQMIGLVNEKEIEKIIDTQNQTLLTFRRTNQALGTFNEFSTKRFHDVHRQFEAHTRMLVTMKADLDSIFRRIRTLQSKLGKQYPKAFEEVARA